MISLCGSLYSLFYFYRFFLYHQLHSLLQGSKLEEKKQQAKGKKKDILYYQMQQISRNSNMKKGGNLEQRTNRNFISDAMILSYLAMIINSVEAVLSAQVIASLS